MAADTAASDGEADSDPPQPGITPPQLSIPKGGGAIRGIDEKFNANPVTGTGSLTLPLPLSPGRSGFGPQLSLSYDSGSGNGCFGMGWNASLPMISRRTDKGIPRYYDSHDEHAADAGTECGQSRQPDIFVLSGAEDLVPVLQCDGNGRWQPDELERDGYCIQRYRPRIEGLFAQIERWTRIADGDIHWRSISKDNTLTLYGIDPASRIADPANPARIFSWLICRSFDNKGNAIIYDYAAVDEDLAVAGSNERNRQRSANRNIKRIRYGNRVPLLEHSDLHPAGWMFELVFDYGEGHYREQPPDRDGRIFAQAGDSASDSAAIRKDPFSSYRAGFEVRQYHLCRRVLMFHHFPQELGVASCLVRSMGFEYHEKAIGSFITKIQLCGHKLEQQSREPAQQQRYLTRSLPPLTLAYTASPLEDPEFEGFRLQEVSPDNLLGLAGGIDGSANRWLDLDAEGIPGVLSAQEAAWFYKPNLGDGRFGLTQVVPARPALATLDAAGASNTSQMLMDVTGEGTLDLVALAPPDLGLAGFHGRTMDAGWEGFRPFRAFPVRDWQDPNLRFVDLTGDGVADVLVTEDNAFTWHPSLQRSGFGPGLRIAAPLDEEAGPRIVFADLEQSIYLADMSGDGLSDIVRIRNGDICYWPNLGYGRFGAKITMDNAPHFDTPDLFDQNRIRLADTDGGGTADILYLAKDGVRVFLNQAGNSWSDARLLRGFPAVDNVASITVTDFLGRGTACLLWSSPLLHDAGRQLRYVDLMCGQKPHLLVRANNNLGAETRLEYASSTEFYLADKSAGTPWITRLPFPVHVVKRVETYDYVSRNRFVSRYSYHHGFYDGVEREFRGFARVDQCDTEEFATLTESDQFPAAANLDAASNVPPILTKTWFQTGAFLHGKHISQQLAHEYYREGDGMHGEARLSEQQAQAMQLSDTVLPQHLTTEEAREACRSLKGAMLRQEVYALDGSAAASRPYAVTDNNYTIRLVQPRQRNRHAVFFTHARESFNFNYDRKLYRIDDQTDNNLHADPRIAHGVTLAVDNYGNVLRSVAIAYGRRFPDLSPQLTQADRDKQARILLTFTENSYTNAVHEADAYRAPLPCKAQLFELINVKPERCLADITNFFSFDEIARQVARAGDGEHDLPFEDWQALGAKDDAPYRRLLKQSRNVYRSNRLDRLLPVGTLESLALPGESYTLAFTPGLLATTFTRPVRTDPTTAQIVGEQPTSLLPEPAAVLGSKAPDGGAYVDAEKNGCWWIPGGKIFFHPDPDATAAAELIQARQHFFLPRRFENPFGHSSLADFDSHDLLATRTVDALGNIASAKNDYRVLRPQVITDANGNRSEVAFDALGAVTGAAVMGKISENIGDSLAGFQADLTTAECERFYADPKGTFATEILAEASARTIYDPERFCRTQQPAYSATLSRATHASDLAAGQQSQMQVGFSYADGFGREIQKKIEAEDGPVIAGGADVGSRWITDGWTIFNNKGKPVRQYESFFDDTHGFKFGKLAGVSSVLFYDPMQRVVATLHPNHSFEKNKFDPWRQESWDVNDTVLISHPEDDPDIGAFFKRLPEFDYLPSWYDYRILGAFGHEEQNAARKAAMHAATPGVSHADALGRMMLNIAHNRSPAPFTSLLSTAVKEKSAEEDAAIEAFFASRTHFDIQGNQREVTDANGRIVVRYDYDLCGNHLHQASMDAGERWLLNDVTNKAIRAWDSRAHQFRTAYDALRRPTDSFLREGAGEELLIERTEYGESWDNPLKHNLRGRSVQVFDQAGVVTSDDYDFKGNLLNNRRRLACEYRNALDWNRAVALEKAAYTSHTRYDAYNRPILLISPDGSIVSAAYNKNSLVERVEARLRGSAEATIFVKHIAYNAKGQRTVIEYGNGTSTSYDYDTLSFRLTRLQTRRDAALPGDACQLQKLHYTFDPAGNITHIRDDAQQLAYFRNHVARPSNDYTYDAIYRLIEGSGREHLGQTGEGFLHSHDDGLRSGLPQPGDGNAMGRYAEQYLYDAVGNILAMQHHGSDPTQPGWKRIYTYQESSPLESGQSNNRLSSTLSNAQTGSTAAAYRYEGLAGLHGNITAMPHLPLMQWDYRDQLQASAQQIAHHGAPETTWYVYDAGGQRVRKVTTRYAPAGQPSLRWKERIYLGGFEIYREYKNDGDTIDLERETLHIMDDKQRVALIESRTQGDDGSPLQLMRYQFNNHLGSSCLELDQQARILTYEEYTPYGNSSYLAVRGQVDTAKRYRYTGQERDEENGFYYHGARYYAPWLGRWINCDPAGITASPNLYAYASNTPTRRIDPSGLDDDEPGWFSSHLGPSSPFAQYLVHGDYVGSSILQDDSKLQTAQHVAEGIALGAATIATAGLALEVVGGAAVVVGGTEATIATTAVVGGTEATVATTAVVGTEATLATTAVVGTEATVATTAVVGTEATVATTAVVGTEATVAGTTATGLTTAQATGLTTAATTAGYAANTPAGQQLIQEAGEVVESIGPALENEAQVISQEVQSLAPRLSSSVPQLSNVTIQSSSTFTAQETQAAQTAKDVFLNNRDPQSASRAGTAFHDAMGAAARGIDLVRGPLEIELKTHWGNMMDQGMLTKASEQSLRYSQQFQAETGLVPIRMVIHYFLNPAFGDSVKVVTH